MGIGTYNLSIKGVPWDAALTGAAVTGVLAIISQMVNKARCYVSCKKDEEGEYCEPRCVCGFIETTLVETAAGFETSKISAMNK